MADNAFVVVFVALLQVGASAACAVPDRPADSDPMRAPGGRLPPAARVEPSSVLKLVPTVGGGQPLVYDEVELTRVGRTVLAKLDDICRYDIERDAWVGVGWHFRGDYTRMEPRSGNVVGAPRVFQDFGGAPGAYPGPGLYRIYWTESRETATERLSPDSGSAVDAPATHRYGAFLHLGTLCQDVTLGEAPPGRIAVCVPNDTTGRAMFAPEPPREGCRS